MKLGSVNSKYSTLRNAVCNCYGERAVTLMFGENLLNAVNLSIFKKSHKTLIPYINFGELSLCTDNWIAYSSSDNAGFVLDYTGTGVNGELLYEKFENAKISQKYEQILFVPPRGCENADFYRKALNLLAPGGRMVAAFNSVMAAEPEFADLRKYIVQSFSLSGIISVNDNNCKISVVAIDNKKEHPDSVLMFSENEIDCNIVSYSEVEQFDVDRYKSNAQRENQRTTTQPDAMPLEEIAEVLNGVNFPADEVRKHGDYLIIHPENIQQGNISFGEKEKEFCSNEFIQEKTQRLAGVLFPGDILVSDDRKGEWAVYKGDEDFVVADDKIDIIRGKTESKEAFNMFFGSSLGVETLKKHLNNPDVNHKNMREKLGNIPVPNRKLQRCAHIAAKGADIGSRLAAMFRELGWTVYEEYIIDGFNFDIALFYDGVFSAVIDARILSYTNDNKQLFSYYSLIKSRYPDVHIFVAIDRDFCEYADGMLYRLLDPPTPLTNWRRETLMPFESVELQGGSSMFCRWMAEVVNTKLDAIALATERIENKVENVEIMLNEISRKFDMNREFVKRHLSMDISASEEEHIYHTYSERCASVVVNELKSKDTDKEYNQTLEELRSTFGSETWSKLESKTQRFLISARIMFNKLQEIPDDVDYSGVCVLVTKALEVELTKRLCEEYGKYLKSRFQKKYSEYPSALLNNYRGKISQRKKSNFTLGMVQYVLCHEDDPDVDEAQNEKNKIRLLEYSRDVLLPNKKDSEIMEILDEFAEEIEDAKRNYRNPSAHAGVLTKISAEKCFDLIIDDDQLLKQLIETFAI